MALKGYRTNLPPYTREVLEKDNNGNSPITNIRVCRKPLKGVYERVIDTVRAVEGINDEPHDKLFHLFMVCSLKNGNELQVEKEEDIKVSYYEPQPTVNCFNIPIVKLLTINEMFQNTINKIGNKSFFHYDAFSDNCQKFIYDNLTSNGIKLSSYEIKFIVQQVDKLVPAWAQRLTGYITDIANRGKTAIFGYGSGSTLQSVIFPQDLFTKNDALLWLKDHNIKKIKPLHETENYFRARITEPPLEDVRYYTKNLPNGIKLVFWNY